MENVYYTYTKSVQNTTYYFVKRFKAFPELKEIEPILEGFGMHTDFNKACDIAGIRESSIKEMLMNELDERASKTKVIELNDQQFYSQRKTGSQ